jgi:hypothetical protein
VSIEATLIDTPELTMNAANCGWKIVALLTLL